MAGEIQAVIFKIKRGGIRTMDIKKLTTALLAIGGLITISALIWWFYFYSQVIKELGGNFEDAAPCLYSSGNGCGFVSGLAELGGGNPYNPTIFWIGIVLLGLGAVLKFSLNNEEK